MKSRFLISLLCVGAVAFACGPRARSDASSASGSTTSLSSTRNVSQQGTPRADRPDPESPLRSSVHVSTDAGAITIALRVVNNGKRSVEVTFPSGQTHDFVILDSLGREMWRWANGRLFTQTLQNRLLSRGEAIALSETWSAPTLKAGRYTVVATLRSVNFPLVERTEFTIPAKALASRQ
jgi:hypothetical protein